MTERIPKSADLATLLASTGMRTGEVLGLQWADVDLVAGEIHVAAAITDGGPGVGIVRKSTKRSDWRDVPLTAAAQTALQRQADRFQDLNGRNPARTLFVFGAAPDYVLPLRPDALSRRWTASRGTSSMTLLDLRHYVATAMLDAGESSDGRPTSLAIARRRFVFTTTDVRALRNARRSRLWSSRPDGVSTI